MKSTEFSPVIIFFIINVCIKCTHSWHILSEPGHNIVGRSFLDGGSSSGMHKTMSDNEISGSGSNSANGAPDNLRNSLYPLSAGGDQDFNENSTIIDVKDGEHSFIQYLTKCVPIIKYCLLTSLSSNVCSLACLLDQNPVGRRLVRVLQETVKQLCSYVQSVYDTGLGKFIDSSHQITRLTQYLRLHGVKEANFPGFASSGASALPMQLIKYVHTPIFDALKPVVASLERTTNTDLIFHSRIAFSNPSCYEVDLNDAMQLMAERIIHYPYVTDVALGGWFVLTNVVYLKLESEMEIFETLLKIMRMFTGVHCSLIQYAETGEATDCQVVSGSKWEGLNRTGHSYKEVCGDLEDTDSADMHKLFPDLFPRTSDKDVAETFYDYEIDEKEKKDDDDNADQS